MRQTIIPVRTILPIAAALAAILTVGTAPAQAISRVETTKTDCSAIRATLIREGAAILRYTSKRGLPIYDRYVSSSLMCESPSIGVLGPGAGPGHQFLPGDPL
jgi:hypothetical protein